MEFDITLVFVRLNRRHTISSIICVIRLMHRVYVIKLIDIFFDSKYSKCNTRKSYRISDLSINRRN